MTRKSELKRKQMRLSSQIGVATVIIVVVTMVIVVSARSSTLKQNEQYYLEREANLEMQKENEEKRSQQLEEQEIFVQTKQYIEKIAREKLGLINPDEIILKPNLDN